MAALVGEQGFQVQHAESRGIPSADTRRRSVRAAASLRSEYDRERADPGPRGESHERAATARGSLAGERPISGTSAEEYCDSAQGGKCALCSPPSERSIAPRRTRALDLVGRGNLEARIVRVLEQ